MDDNDFDKEFNYLKNKDYEEIAHNLFDSTYKGRLDNLNIDIDVIREEINKTIDIVFDKLDVVKSSNMGVQYSNIYKIFKYLVLTSTYDQNIMSEKLEDDGIPLDIMETKDIYRCLCQHRSVCTSDSAALALMLRRCGILSAHATIADKEMKSVHEITLFKLENELYVGDVTQIRTILPNIDNVVTSKMTQIPLIDYFTFISPDREIKCIHDPIEIISKNFAENEKDLCK